MILWVDVSDIVQWKQGQLSGIQRTVVSVIEELSKLRSDLRLFRFDPAIRHLREVPPSSLFEAIQKHMPNLSLHFADQAQRGPINGEGIPSAPVVGTPRVTPFIGSVRQAWGASLGRMRRLVASSRPLEIARRRTPAPIKRLAKALGVKLPGGAANLVPPATPLFEPGDVCLSMSATWAFPGYGETIAANLHGRKVKCINTIYDLTPALFPHWASEDAARRFTHWLRTQIQNADMLLTLSLFQKKEIETFLSEVSSGHPPVEAIRLGDTFPAAYTEHPSPLPRYVPSGPFVLCVSTLHVRKNHHCLYHVWRRLASALEAMCPRLLLVGIPTYVGFRDLLFQIRHNPVVNRLIVTIGDARDEEILWYYKNCQFTIYPSLYEGWGLPIAESLQLGKYCIASAHASMQEVGGDLVDRFDPIDYKACFDLVYRAITEPDYVRAREEEIRARYKGTSWAATARQISDLIDRVTEISPRQPAASEAF